MVASLKGDYVHVIFTRFDMYLLIRKQASLWLQRRSSGSPPPAHGIPRTPADGHGAASHIQELTEIARGAWAPSDVRVAVAGHDDPSGQNAGRIEKILGALVDGGSIVVSGA